MILAIIMAGLIGANIASNGGVGSDIENNLRAFGCKLDTNCEIVETVIRYKK